MSTWDELSDDEREASGKGYDGAGSDGADERLAQAEIVPFNEWVQRYGL